MIYTDNDQALQEPEILTEDLVVSPQEEVDLFWSRLVKNPNRRVAVRAIADEWQTGCYDAAEAVAWLRMLKLHSGSYKADPYDLMTTIALREFGPVVLPERGEAA